MLAFVPVPTVDVSWDTGKAALNRQSAGSREVTTQEDFGESYRRYRAAVVFKVIKETKAQLADAEDAVQESALGAWRIVRRGKSSRTIRAYWSYTVKSAVNAVGDRVEKEAKRRDVLASLECRFRLRDPDAADLWARRRAWLPGAVRRLPVREKDVVVRRLEGKRDSEIARLLGIADQSIRVFHARAVTRLRRMALEEGLRAVAA